MPKVWNVFPQGSDDIIEQLFFNRGIKSIEEKELFLNPKIDDFADDLQIKNLNIAQKRILKAVKRNELIYINGDYDVDGICGAAVLYLGLTSIGARVIPYLPHREKEGYGISKICLDEAKLKGAKLIITVDCGIVDFKKAEYAKNLGLDLIITDHHQLLDGKIPESFAVIHSTVMCGTAVAWCLVKGMITQENSTNLLDLVALATVADMMPMLGINRAFIKAGLKILNSTNQVGMLALINVSGIKKGSIGSYEIGHVLAPRLNAVGRLADAMDGLRLLCTKNPKKAADLANLLEATNIQRQKLTVDAISTARTKAGEQIKKIHVLSDESWHPGIIGLVAGRICEELNRPIIAISVGKEYSKGSARSIDGINIVEILRKCSDILTAIGGHPGAAGFTIETTKISELQNRIDKLLEPEILDSEPIINIDAKLKSENVSMNLAYKILQFEPFGIKNHRPVFASFNLKVSSINTVGNGKHLKIKAEGKELIGFNMGDLSEILQPGSILDVAYNLDINRFNGSEKLQLVIKDLKVS